MPAKNDDYLKRLIERRMRDLDLRSVRDMERRAGFNQDAIRNILRGKNKTIHMDSIIPLARILKVSVSEILGQQVTKSDPALSNAATLKVYKPTASLAKKGAAAETVALITVDGDISGVKPNPETDYFIPAGDNSMMPTFARGDLVMVRQGDNELQPRTIYLISPKAGGSPALRRLNIRMSDGLLDISADNESFPVETGIDPKKLNIIGRAMVAVKRL